MYMIILLGLRTAASRCEARLSVIKRLAPAPRMYVIGLSESRQPSHPAFRLQDIDFDLAALQLLLLKLDHQ